MHHYLIEVNDPFLRSLDAEHLLSITTRVEQWGRTQQDAITQIDRWFRNFANKDKELAFRVFERLDYYSPNRIKEVLHGLATAVRRFAKERLNTSDLSRVLVITPPGQADSAHRHAYDFAKEIHIPRENVKAITQVTRGEVDGRVFVLLNDTHGSGNQFRIEVLPALRMLDIPHDHTLILAFAVAGKALDTIACEAPGITIFPDIPAPSIHTMFSEKDVRQLTELGRVVYPKWPIGYGDTGLLVAYYFQCPNNTIPIIWANGRNNGTREQAGYPWDPLIPYEPKASPVATATARPAEMTNGPKPSISAGSVHRSNPTLIRRGRMRTAYPTDLSFAQLYDQDLYIEPRMSAFRDRGAPTAASNPERAVTDVIEKLITQRSVLVLGEPGAGKSFLTYLIQRRLVKQGADATCLGFLDVLDTVAASGLSGQDQEIIILDGLDEDHVEGVRLAAAMSLSTALSVRGRILCVCRREDYELAICRILPSQCFDEILFVLPWRLDIEFPRFVEKLAIKHYARAPEILSAVRDVPALQSLVTRPLHARMLSYLWQDDETSPPMLGQDLTFLYGAYMRKFARSVAGTSAEAWTEQDVLALWRALAWSVFRGEAAHRGRIEARTLVDLLDDRPTLQRAVHGILNRVESARGEYHQFLHYSFYEFLVSWEFVEQLYSACTIDNVAAAVALFRRDMPREIRHHAVAQLRSDGFASSSRLTHFLARVYDLARQEDDAERSLLETCNLIVYFLSRCTPESASPHLSRLLSTETLPFLRTSLYWGAAAADMIDCTRAYVDELLGNKDMRVLNRGYHLYYYGDLDRQTAPPYEDNDSAANWSRTRLAVGERTRLPQSGPFAKSYLGLVTFLDLAHFHAARLDEVEDKWIKQEVARMKDVWGEQVSRVCQASLRNSTGDL